MVVRFGCRRRGYGFVIVFAVSFFTTLFLAVLGNYLVVVAGDMGMLVAAVRFILFFILFFIFGIVLAFMLIRVFFVIMALCFGFVIITIFVLSLISLFIFSLGCFFNDWRARWLRAGFVGGWPFSRLYFPGWQWCQAWYA